MDHSQAYLLGEDEDDDLPDVDLDGQDVAAGLEARGSQAGTPRSSDADAERAQLLTEDGIEQALEPGEEEQERAASAEGPSAGSDTLADENMSSSAAGGDTLDTDIPAAPLPEEGPQPETEAEGPVQLPQEDTLVINADNPEALAQLVSQSGLIFC